MLVAEERITPSSGCRLSVGGLHALGSVLVQFFGGAGGGGTLVTRQDQAGDHVNFICRRTRSRGKTAGGLRHQVLGLGPIMSLSLHIWDAGCLARKGAINEEVVTSENREGGK